MLGNRINISIPLIASLVAIAVGGLVVMLYLFDIAAAVLGPGTGDIEPDARLSRYVEQHEDEMQTHAERFDGRSVFYIPQIRTVYKPPPPEPDVTQTPIDPPKPIEPAPIDPTYTGPSPMFAVGSEVWFEKPHPDEPHMRLRVGETAHNVKLVSVSLPAYITIEFKGKEFRLDLLGDTFGGSWESDENGSEDFVARDAGRERPTPGIKVITKDGEHELTDDQPALTARDLDDGDDESSSSMARPEPISTNLNFEFAQPHGGDVDDDETDNASTPVTNSLPGDDEWYGPPIPDHLLAEYTNATMLGKRDGAAANDEEADAVAAGTSSSTTPQPPRDLEAEDERAAGDPEAEAQAEAEAGTTREQTPTERPERGVIPENPIVPPE